MTVRFISFILVAVLAQSANARDFVGADIYYYGWTVVTRGRLTLDFVRRNASMKSYAGPSETDHLVTLLRLDKMAIAKAGDDRSTDPRLVIDLWDEAGRRTTVYAGTSSLVSEDGRRWRDLDREFKQHFTFGPVP